jgi:hypothetical protein
MHNSLSFTHASTLAAASSFFIRDGFAVCREVFSLKLFFVLQKNDFEAITMLQSYQQPIGY